MSHQSRGDHKVKLTSNFCEFVTDFFVTFNRKCGLTRPQVEMIENEADGSRVCVSFCSHCALFRCLIGKNNTQLQHESFF